MASFQISLRPNRRAAARFIASVHRVIGETYAEAKRAGLKQSEIARALDVHRSVINREFRGMKDMSLGRVGELAWAMGKEAEIRFVDPVVPAMTNRPAETEAATREAKSASQPSRLSVVTCYSAAA